MGIEKEWNYLKEHFYHTALSDLETSKRVKNYWFEDKLQIIQHVLEQKRQAVLKYKSIPSEANKACLRAVQTLSKPTAMECVNRYWLKLGEKNQHDSDIGNLKRMYDGITKA